MIRTRYRLVPIVVAAILSWLLSPATSHVALAHGSTSTTPNSSQVICDVTCGGGGGDPFWGANWTWMQTAVDANHAAWPQQNSNWCGVADLAAINNYDWQRYSGSMNPTYKTQSSVANHLQSNAAISPWGVAVSHPLQGSAFKANIAADYGTDPRAMAWGIYDITPPGYWFHNYNYSQNDNSTANSATYQVALDYGPAHGTNAPVIVVIWGGRHALIQDGVYANTDPSAGGETISAIDLWDSAYSGPGTGYLFGYQHAAISTNTWETATSLGNSGYWFWSTPYDTGWNGNTGDPDPQTSGGGSGATQNYYNVKLYDSSATLVWHWSHAWVSIEQDYVNTVCGGSPNYALNRYGGLDRHNGSVACG